MFKILISISLLSISLLADKEEAKTLFNESDCLKCHAVSTFKAREHKVNNFKKLHKTVERCVNGSNAGWFEEEIKDVALYLNEDYYHFKKE